MKGDGKTEGNELSEATSNFLLDGPASINDVCKKLDISWATAKAALEEMTVKGIVKEIVSNPKIRIFKLSIDPAFYGVPLTREQKGQALFLFQNIRQEWHKQSDKPLLSTTLQKIAVDVAIECKCDIPVVTFHYGMVVPVVDTSFFEYKTPVNSSQILQSIKNVIPSHNNRCKDEIDSQYTKYKMFLFQSKEGLKEALNNQKKEKDPSLEKVQSALSDFLIKCPTDNKSYELFDLCYNFSSKINGLILTKGFSSNIEEVKEAFDILWDLITTNFFFKEIEKYVGPDKKEVFEYIKSSQILAKKANVEERINYLGSLINLSEEIKLPMDEESIAIRRILAEGAEEE